MTWMTLALWVVTRGALVAMFPLSAAEKLWHWKNALAQTETAGLPGAPALLAIAVLVEGLPPFFILFGWFDRPAAVLLAGFCVVTAFLYHPFWAFPDFFARADDSKSREHFWQFVKNFGLVGGLLLVVFAGATSDPISVLDPGRWSSLHEAHRQATP
jgi:putative oxidoreductase